MNIRRKQWSLPVALAAAWLLLLQSTFGAFALGAAPDPTQLDAFGNVICTRDGATQLPGGQRPAHLPACCTLGCNMVSATYAPPPGVGMAPVSLSFEPVAFVAPVARHLDFTRERSPANPRAPPLAA